MPRRALPRPSSDVLIVGAGVAGLSTARSLRAQGLGVTVIDARDRLGGRVHTLRERGWPLPIELGAEFIHGSDETTAPLLETAGLVATDMGGHRYSLASGKLRQGTSGESTFLAFKALARRSGTRSMGEVLALAARDRRLAPAVPMLRGFIEGFHAADPDDLSAEEYARDGDGAASSSRVVNGYDTLVDWLASGLHTSDSLCLGMCVTHVARRRDGVEIVARSIAGGSQHHFRARRAVITVPLGVLQAPANAPGAIDFDPAPREQLEAARSIGFGGAIRGVLRFKRAFWERGVAHLREGRARDLGFLHALRAPFPTFWTMLPLRAPLLTAWAAGPAAERLATPNQSLIERAVESLCMLFGESRQRIETELLAWRFHDWCSDPFSRGAYSYVRPGKEHAMRALARPVDDTLFFAGEATDYSGGYSTIDGALRSGLRTAQHIAAIER